MRFFRALPVVSTIPDRLPAAVYLARLAPGSRRVLRGALDTLVALRGVLQAA